MKRWHTRFSTQAGTPPAGTLLNKPSKQTAIIEFSYSELEHLEPKRKQASNSIILFCGFGNFLIWYVKLPPLPLNKRRRHFFFFLPKNLFWRVFKGFFRSDVKLPPSPLFKRLQTFQGVVYGVCLHKVQLVGLTNCLHVHSFKV